MVSVDKIEQGIANYLDSELMPQLQSGGLEKVLIGTVASLFVRKAGTIITGYKDNKVVKMLGVMDEEGNIDIETVSQELKKNIAAEGFKVEIPVVGTLTFHKEDVDKLCNYITA